MINERKENVRYCFVGKKVPGEVMREKYIFCTFAWFTD